MNYLVICNEKAMVFLHVLNWFEFIQQSTVFYKKYVFMLTHHIKIKGFLVLSLVLLKTLCKKPRYFSVLLVCLRFKCDLRSGPWLGLKHFQILENKNAKMTSASSMIYKKNEIIYKIQVCCMIIVKINSYFFKQTIACYMIGWLIIEQCNKAIAVSLKITKIMIVVNRFSIERR